MITIGRRGLETMLPDTVTGRPFFLEPDLATCSSHGVAVLFFVQGIWQCNFDWCEYVEVETHELIQAYLNYIKFVNHSSSADELTSLFPRLPSCVTRTIGKLEKKPSNRET